MYKIGQLFDIFRGKGLCKDDLSDEGNDCILYGQLYTEYLYNIEKITYKTNKEIHKPILSKKGDIILPGSGESKYDISNSAVVPYNGVIYGGDLIILRPKKEIDSLYFSYLITNKLKKQIYKISQGVSIIHLPIDDLSKIEITYPSFNIQNKLSRFLFFVDKKMGIIEKKIGILKKYKKGLLKNILISKEYTIKLGQFCEMYQPQTITQNLFICNGDHPVYGANGIIGYYNNFNHMNSEVVIGCRGNCESVILTKPFSWINGNAMVIKISRSINISKDELFYLLQTVNFHKYIEKSGVAQITCKKAKQIEIPYPTNYSKIIILGLNEIDKKIDKFISILSIINKCKTYLLKNLFI